MALTPGFNSKPIFKYLLLTVCMMKTTYSTAQNQYNQWYFGDQAALDFNTGTPVPLTNSAMFSFEGSAGICDSSGNIMFYTNGGSSAFATGGVWNRNHQLMPNGDFSATHGCNSSDQGALIIPDPGNTNLFYLFTLDCIENSLVGGLRFSVIDMTLDSGNGDVTIKDSLIETDMTEAMCGIRHGNGIDFWVVAHKSGSTEYRSYLVNASGIQAPVISAIGPSANSSICQVKANAAGNKICMTVAYPNAALFDFDNTTGVISNFLDLNRSSFGSSFAPGGNLLYVLAFSPSYTLVQFDLTAANIPASSVDIALIQPGQHGEGMMLARDCKIYIAKANQPYLDVINYPDSAGTACGFINNGVYLGTHQCRYELPNNIDGLFANICNGFPSVNLASSDTFFCSKQFIDFTDLSINNPTSWSWYFQGAVPDTSTAQNPSGIYYGNYGSFDVSLKVCNAGGCDSIFLPGFISVYQTPVVPAISQSHDTLFCSSAYTYSWYEAANPSLILSSDSFLVITQNGNYYVIIADSNGCEVSSNLFVINTGISQLPDENHLFDFYPNPASGIMYINFTSPDVENQIKIINVLGEEFFNASNSKKQIAINISALSAGVYFLEISEGRKRTIEKFAVVR